VPKACGMEEIHRHQLIRLAPASCAEILAGDEPGGEWVKTGRKPSKTAGLMAANSTRKSMPNAR
jgi:hypothetical protein